MKKKNVKTNENYLDRVPKIKDGLSWEQGDGGEVILLLENKGMFNRAAQLLLKKPKYSKIHLDDLGGYAWKLADGKKSIYEIGKSVKETFGEKAEPLYERLSKYFDILFRYGFIEF